MLIKSVKTRFTDLRPKLEYHRRMRIASLDLFQIARFSVRKLYIFTSYEKREERISTALENNHWDGAGNFMGIFIY
jgi:hypothetical protein